ncbi:MAG: bifunctional 2-polyprenyl-6-hydroxyphenol methylase/3-demethylubiquinol 3-O-methyltransferase UbiG [Candidatus Nitrotoga sp.]|nr:bifunctional 2-polyprenyl-6-hydroxyphenol methylase/3-demethylubiquinol 3-O-methyltransferase UbiG [Candidatus Nitrotoga sp.]MBP0116769.1 bifunctional 2-polyprenyl-6-hydroxyphenol methylase/3-demethylubiquinol 3-O-methyltransferase UbiG [Candidatus Nitrotoga sp.]MBP0122663.1 bifunctional 2-polyprenyl-6-hydroxyphenol methylase/3-demethylubiquinol 3-O-methyltransferase UbiG [Candidatus Nitrotoga sp.]MBP0125613.1 bifunctional 2-polyprenyl-6-hydroxyphenol methylase/3-demethylubiquinol 3-O-methylt
MTNADPIELEKFSQLAHHWWDPTSEFKPLHEINPLRLGYIDHIASLSGKSVLDVGCGGGILSEGMAALGAHVTGIDLGDKALQVAKLHLLESGQQVSYHKVAAEDLAAEQPGHYDVVTCLELLEHVPDPSSIVCACAQLVKPGGHVFFSTINRNPKSYLFAVLGAEYLLRLLPRGTHDYAKFIKPSELAQFCRNTGLVVNDISGMGYNLLSKTYSLGKSTDVNYLLACVRD